MKPVDLDELERLEKAATVGEWDFDGSYLGRIFSVRPDGEDENIAEPDGPNWDNNANYILALRNAAPAMIEELRELRASRVPPEREELLLAAMDAATARAERDAMRAEVEGLKAAMALATAANRQAVEEREAARAAEAEANAIIEKINGGPGYDNGTYCLHGMSACERCYDLWSERRRALEARLTELRAQLATAHDALRLFEEGRKLFVDGLDDRAQDRFEQAADAMKTTKGGGA